MLIGASLALGSNQNGRFWSLWLRGEGELVGEKERISERCFDVWERSHSQPPKRNLVPRFNGGANL